jgi:hypothetical protein
MVVEVVLADTARTGENPVLTAERLPFDTKTVVRTRNTDD